MGGWHTHAPHDANGGWVSGDVPSFEDMQNAIQYGQYLTLSFQPDGFDLYDASFARWGAARSSVSAADSSLPRSACARAQASSRRGCGPASNPASSVMDTLPGRALRTPKGRSIKA